MKHFSALVAAVVGLTALNSSAEAASSCDASTVKGTYALHVSGSVGTGPFTPFVAAAISIFDGAGHFTITNGYAVLGGAAATKFTSSGTYSVEGDCSIFINGATSPGASENDHFGVIQDFGNTINAIRTNPGRTVSLNYVRIAP